MHEDIEKYNYAVLDTAGAGEPIQFYTEMNQAKL